MPMTPAALKAECTNDPASLGLADLYGLGSDDGCAVILNDPAHGGNVTDPSISKEAFLLAITPAYLSLPSLSASVQAKWDRVLAGINASSRVDISSAAVQALLATAVTDSVLTQAQVDAIGRRAGSRAEVLWGAGTVVRGSDVGAARKV